MRFSLGGVISGENCNNSVQSTNAYDATNYGRVGPGDWTYSGGSIGPAGTGDSGSPYYRYNASGVTALGTIESQSGTNPAPCGGNPYPFQHRTCATTIFSMEIVPQLNLQNSTLLTTTWTAPCCSASDTLTANQTVGTSQSLNSASQKFSLVVQGSDGNLVLYSANRALWYNGVSGRTGAWLVLQGSDGNLCEYVSAGAVWCSGTQGNVGDRLVMQGDGNLVIYTSSNVAIWYTSTQHA
jgi:hypothetical protein